jgi:hypothetical protein
MKGPASEAKWNRAKQRKNPRFPLGLTRSVGFWPMLAFPFQWAILVATNAENTNKNQEMKTPEDFSEAARQRPSHQDDLRQQMTLFLASPSTQNFIRWLAHQPPTTHHHPLLQFLSHLTQPLSHLQPP